MATARGQDSPLGGRPPRCLDCRHFEADPGSIEKEFPGLATLSSAWASVMGDDGLCRLHDRLCSARQSCARFDAADATPTRRGAIATEWLDEGMPDQTPRSTPSHAPRSRAEDGPIILLQGPVSGFFGAFATYIAARSRRAIKVDFNLADMLSDHCADRLVYDGDIENLEAWFETLFEELRPRAVVVFGDQRPVHVRAKQVCDRHGVTFFSFDEGYIRPDHVTLERGGNNAHSSLPRSPAQIRDFPPPPPPKQFGANFAPMSIQATKYYCLMFLGRLRFIHNVHHRNQSLRHELASWLRAFGQKMRWRRHENKLSEDYARANAGRFFLIALQKYDDAQLYAHGRGWNAERLITEALASFAAYAPADALVVIKQHPLNTGYRDFAPLIRKTAARLGVMDRLLYLQNGNQLELLSHARGLVTINSTMGLAAMGYGCPVLALGDCFYALPGLAVEAEGVETLDAFWSSPPAVDSRLYARFRAHILAQTQINGDFYLRASWPGLMENALRRILDQSGGAQIAWSDPAL